MSVGDELESVGKAAFLRAANAPILAGGRLVIAGMKLTRGVGEPADGGSDASRLTTPITVTVDSENPIGPPPAPAIGQWTAKGNHMSGDLRVSTVQLPCGTHAAPRVRE
jgi:hypothetical protein